MKIRITVYVFVKSKVGWINGFFQGTISSPCNLNIGQTIEFPEIGNSIDEENRARVVEINHKYDSTRNSTYPEILCLSEFDFDKILSGTNDKEMRDEMEIELRNWNEEALPSLSKAMKDFSSGGFKEIIKKKPDHYEGIPGATLK